MCIYIWGGAVPGPQALNPKPYRRFPWYDSLFYKYQKSYRCRQDTMGVKPSRYIRRPDGMYMRVTDQEATSVHCFFCKKETTREYKVEVDPFRTAYVCKDCYKNKDLHGPR